MFGYVCYGWDSGRTAILCPRQVCHVRCSWECHERRTAVLIDSLLILPVYMSHGGYEGENHITVLEIVKVITEEGRDGQGLRRWRDLNIELKLEAGEGKFQGLDGFGGYDLYWPECCGGGEDPVIYEKNFVGYSYSETSIAWRQGDFHTRRGWGPRRR